MLVFSTQLCERLPTNLLSGSTFPLPPSLCQSTVCTCIYRQCVAGRGWGVGSSVGDHILHELNTLYLTRFRTYKIARPPQEKT
jgi:hypothetical protein